MNSRLILIITAVIVVIIILGFLFQKSQIAQISPTSQTLSSDPDYQPVKEKYNLSEEQLQILSTVNQEDRD